MRWAIFILLLLEALFCASAIVPSPVGQTGPFWPFDVRVLNPGILTTSLAGTAILCFVLAITGLFWQTLPLKVWQGLVAVGAIASLLISTANYGPWTIAPILIDLVLLLGVVTKRWVAAVVRMRTLQNTSEPIHPLMHVPVPWVFVMTYLIALVPQFLWPIEVPRGDVLFVKVGGAVLMFVGVLLAGWSLGIFRSIGTTTVPFETSSKLVTWGPYRFSRNPMYVSLTLIYLGEAGMLAQIWPVLWLPLTLAYIRWVIVPTEEERLRAAFGDTYRQYCSSVRRWI